MPRGRREILVVGFAVGLAACGFLIDTDHSDDEKRAAAAAAAKNDAGGGASANGGHDGEATPAPTATATATATATGTSTDPVPVPDAGPTTGCHGPNDCASQRCNMTGTDPDGVTPVGVCGDKTSCQLPGDPTGESPGCGDSTCCIGYVCGDGIEIKGCRACGPKGAGCGNNLSAGCCAPLHCNFQTDQCEP